MVSIVAIDVSNNFFSGTIPTEIGKLSQLGMYPGRQPLDGIEFSRLEEKGQLLTTCFPLLSLFLQETLRILETGGFNSSVPSEICNLPHLTDIEVDCSASNFICNCSKCVCH